MFSRKSDVLSLAAMVLIFGPVARAQEFSIDWYTMDGGGGYSSGENFELEGTIGQHDAGVSSGGDFVLTGGFWNFSVICAGIDADSDGVSACTDCDDNNDQVYPGQSETLCDDIDNDCDPATEDNPSDACTVEAVVLAGEGPRYLEVTPADGAVAVALQITSGDAPCLQKYIDLDPSPVLAAEGIATLVSAPVYRLPADWGVLHVRGQDIVPGYNYTVQPEVEGVGPVAQATTFATFDHGDVDNNSVSNFADIQLVVQGFQQTFNGPLGAVDLAPCEPNAIVNFEDIQQAVFAFQQQAYDLICSLPCDTSAAAAEDTYLDKKPASLKLLAGARRIGPGETVQVDVWVEGATDLHAMQVGLDVSGGSAGTMTMADAWIDQEAVGAFTGTEIVKAVNLARSQAGAISLAGSIDAERSIYLASFLFEASYDASGAFVIRLQEEAGSMLLNSWGAPITLDAANEILVKVVEAPERTRRVHDPVRGKALTNQ